MAVRSRTLISLGASARTENDTRRIQRTDPPRDLVFAYGILIDEVPDDAIELVGIFHEHEVVAALFHFKDLHLCVADL